MTNYGFKLFEQVDGKLYPLFITAKQEVPVNQWIDAENGDTKGKFAPRPGWHIGEIPDAPWLKSDNGTDVGYYKSKRGKKGRRVWAQVEYHTDVNWQEAVARSGKKWLTDQIPVGGCYHFKEAGNRPWIIAGEMRVVRVLSEDERQDILTDLGYDEAAAFATKRAAFAKRRLSVAKQSL